MRPADASPDARGTGPPSSAREAAPSEGGGPRRAPDFLAVVGPTAAGKTALSLAVAEVLGGEIVSMDSRQVYRGMDVGTAKATAEERARIPHHGLDLLDPDERYSAGAFGRDARRWIREIRGRGRVPLLVGGTGFFLRVLTHPIFREPELEPGRLRRLRRRLRRLPRERLEAWVLALDPERASVAAEGGAQRLIRTLEVALLTGRPLSWWHRRSPPEAPPLDPVVVRLTLPREELDRRIAERTRRMLERGLVDEVRGLLEAGYRADDPGLSGVGYREIAEHLRGERTLESAASSIVRSTRRYARRQSTWFRHQLPEGTVPIDATAPLERQVGQVVAAWRVREEGTRREGKGP